MNRSTTVVFTGDSVTDCGRRDDPAGIGDGYVGLLAATEAFAAARIVNTGVGGDLTVDLAARWERDVLAHRPAVVSVLIGINDVWRRYDGTGRITTAEEYAATLRGMLARLDPGTRLVLVEPFALPVGPGQERWEAEDLGAKRAVVRDLAAGTGAAFVPAQQALIAAIDPAAGAAGLTADGVHPTARGHEVLARAWQAAMPGLQ